MCLYELECIACLTHVLMSCESAGAALLLPDRAEPRDYINYGSDDHLHYSVHAQRVLVLEQVS